MSAHTGWTEGATQAAQFLASHPSGSTTLERTDLRSLMLETGGTLIARGSLYDIEAKSLGAGVYRVTLRVRKCHETHDAHCIGWLVNQVGPGNNIGLRMRMSSCTNARAIRLRGEQHETFEDTLP